MSKARDLADSAQEINILDGKSFLDEDNLASDSATGIASQQSIKAYVDGITTTNITSTGALNSGSITSGFGNIDNGSSTITTTGAITGGSFVIGSADINENDLESIDGITAGTVSASKAVVVNTNKDITGFRNITATGTISGTVSGSLSSTTTATTQAESDDSTKIATTAYVTDKITTLIGGAPSTLNDLNELAAAINDDANYNSTLTTALGTKLAKAGGTMTGDIAYLDNVKAKFGAGDDLQIFHDGSNSFINEGGAGDLTIKASNNLYLMSGSSEVYAKFTTDGAATLYHNNSAKLATTSTGVDVTGTAVMDGLTVDGGGSRQYINSGHLRLSDNYNLEWGGGTNAIQGSNASNHILLKTNNTERMRIDNSGNLLVGKTSANAGIAGVAIEADGDAYFTAEGANGRVLYANRLTSDGDIMQFAKNGSTIGNIAVTGTNDLTLYSTATNHKGLRLGEGYYIPVNNSGSPEDNSVDIGMTSYRYKNVHAVNYYGDGSNLTGIESGLSNTTSTGPSSQGTFITNPPGSNSNWSGVNGRITNGLIIRDTAPPSSIIVAEVTLPSGNNLGVVYGTLTFDEIYNPSYGNYYGGHVFFVVQTSTNAWEVMQSIYYSGGNSVKQGTGTHYFNHPARVFGSGHKAYICAGRTNYGGIVFNANSVNFNVATTPIG